MKTFRFLFLILILTSSCASNQYLLSDKGPDKTYLSDYISHLQKERTVLKHPLVIVDGKAYRYNVELKNNKLPVTKEEIKYIRVVDWMKAKKTYGDAALDGAILISTQISMEVLKDSFDPGSNMLILLDGTEISAEKMNSLDPLTIKEIEVITIKETLKKYTSGDYNGVILIELK